MKECIKCYRSFVNPLMTNVPNHIGTSQLICIDCFLFDGEHWSLIG